MSMAAAVEPSVKAHRSLSMVPLWMISASFFLIKIQPFVLQYFCYNGVINFLYVVGFVALSKVP